MSIFDLHVTEQIRVQLNPVVGSVVTHERMDRLVERLRAVHVLIMTLSPRSPVSKSNIFSAALMST
jgi:hypothetical protein